MTENVKLQMRVSPDFIQAVDDWRRRQPKIPTRAQAIQVLVAVAIIASDSVTSPLPQAKGAYKAH